jgi:hypothetical protein
MTSPSKGREFCAVYSDENCLDFRFISLNVMTILQNAKEQGIGEMWKDYAYETG